MSKTITISEDDLEGLHNTAGFVPVYKYAVRIPQEFEVGSVDNFRIIMGPPRDPVLVAIQDEIKKSVEARASKGLEIESLQAQCAMIGHQRMYSRGQCRYCARSLEDYP